MDDRYAKLEKRVGARTVAHDVVTASQVARLDATLNRTDPPLKDGDPVPWGWQAIFFPGTAPTATLVSDGTASDLEDTPGDPLPRRMYAGDEFTFHEPLRVGDRAVRETFVKSVQAKQGRSGKLVFVTTAVRISGPRGLVLENDQRTVYRDREPEGLKLPPAPGESARMDAPWKRRVTMDPVTLFRFSACCFNPHRIHYDHPYATGVEGYPALVVQGPLTAVLLLELVREHAREKELSGYVMRARSPLFANQPFALLGEPSADGASCRLWAANEAGELAMEISATFR